jgi:large subunit ribosomal protein L21
VGERVQLADVLLVADGEQTHLGQPRVEGAQVWAEVIDQRQGSKVIHFDYRNKHRRRKTLGHRQLYTRVEIKDIVVNRTSDV